MWGAPEEPPDDTEVAGSSVSAPDPSASVKEICKEDKLNVFKDMLKNKNDWKKKKEEAQEYASKLSQIKSRSKRSRLSKGSDSTTVETASKPSGEDISLSADQDTVDDISQAKTPKAKSSLLQRKLAENRKIFEQRSKEMIESKRAVEEKVEAIRQQMDQTDLTIVEAQKDQTIVTPVRPVLITSQIVTTTEPQGLFQARDNKIAELNNRILELEATIIDLQDNLREKDSVIDSKTKAVTLMSADLSKKGKSTLDTLEDTKDEMRTMQENFVLIETSLRNKNENLLEQLHERNDRVTDLEAKINRFEQEMEEKRLEETASASLSRTTMDTLADTKDEMRSMQENFVLIETSLREKNDNLLRQLEERETKLAEAEERIYKLESGAGIVAAPEIPDLQYKIARLEQSNLVLQDEKYELQKSIAELQEKIIIRESTNGNGLIVEKDNRIAELENLIEELKNSNQLLEEESKAELQKQVDELTTKNDEFRNKIDYFERINSDLEIEKNELRAKIPEASDLTKEDDTVKNLKKELEDLNKSMIKLKAQHKSKLRNLQKQLESFKMVSDANAELVKLGNQVALLEEEKASAGDWQDRIADLESRVSTQANDIQAHVEAIAILENQKLDLMQDLHTARQEISALEAENAESENLRVTAEMKIVDMEEQLESLNKLNNENLTSESSIKDSSSDLHAKIVDLTRENSELQQRIVRFEEKASSEAGSTESFETIHEDRNELLKRMELLSARNLELEDKLSKLEEITKSNVGSTESFETINDTDRSELVKKIDLLSRENSDLVTRLNKFEEKGSSDTGSTESFEKIPEHGDGLSRIEILTRENNELVIKLTKLEEKMDNLVARKNEEYVESSISEDVLKNDEKFNNLIRENNDLVIELVKIKEKLSQISEEKEELEKLVSNAKHQDEIVEDMKTRVNSLTAENHDLIAKLETLEGKKIELRENLKKLGEDELTYRKNRENENIDRSATMVTVQSLETEIETCRKLITEQTELVEEMKTKLTNKEAELEEKVRQIEDYEATGISVENLQRELTESFGIIEEWKYKCEDMERKMEILESGKIAIEDGLKILQDENRILMEESKQKDLAMSAIKRELDDTIVNFANRFDEERAIAVKQEEEITKLQELLLTKDQELHEKYHLLQNEMINIDSLQEELNERRAQLENNEKVIFTLNEEIQRLKAETIVSKEQVSITHDELVVLREELSTKAAKEARNEELVEQMKNTMNNQLRENSNLQTMMENSSAEIENLRTQLFNKNNEVASLLEEKSSLEEKIHESILAKDSVEDKFVNLKNNLDDSVKYANDLRVELSDAYKMMELLKIKHTEDVDMQNRRLEDLINDLNAKTSECEILQRELTDKTKLVEDLEAKKLELEICREELIEKEILIEKNITENVKVDLEARVKELKDKLSESEANTQTQLQKRKILAANLKKKSAQYEELEAKAAEFEKKATEFEAKATEFEAKVKELEPKTMELGTKAELFEAKATELEAKVTELENKIVELENEAAAFEAKATEFESRVAEFEAKATDLGIKAAEYETEAKELRLKIAHYEEKAAENEAKAANYEAKVTDFEAKVTELESKVTTYEAKTLELETKAIELEAKAAKFESEATEFKVKSSNFEAKVQELEPKTATLEIRAAEFEAKALEFEEKWISEKSEKDASNLKIQENERTIREKNEMILHLEDQLNSVRNEAEFSINRAETLSTELQRSTEKIATLMSEITEMFEEMKNLRSEIETKSLELEDERIAKENLITEYEAQRKKKLDDDALNQQIMEEAREKARELGVRMQVMESEYVDQLNTIQTLRTENGMLVSKQAQINERLENAEKEASERKILLDQIEQESVQRETEIHRRDEATSDEEQSRNDEKQSCDHCDQRQTVVQALEAKLQEREAEIENLDNELANSIGNFVHMRESLRVSDLMNQSTSRTRNQEESREINDLVYQYNVLTARNAELNDQLTYKIRENQELNEKISSLEALNAALRERTGAAESELIESGELSTARTIDDNSNDRIGENLQARDNELLNARSELQIIKQSHEESIDAARLRIQQLELYNLELTRNCDDLTRSRNEAETEIVSLREESSLCQQKILELQAEVDKYRDENTRLADTNSREPRAASSFFSEEKDDSPKLFDAAKLFGPTVTMDSNEQREVADLRKVLANKDLEIISLSQEIKRLGEEIVGMESHVQQIITNNSRELEISRDNCQKWEMELIELRKVLDERNNQIDALNVKLKNVEAQFGEQFDQRQNNDGVERTVERLKVENEESARGLRDSDDNIEKSTEKIELVGNDNVQLMKMIDFVFVVLNEVLGDIEHDRIQALSDLQAISPIVHSRLVEITNYMNSMKNEKTELLVLLDNCKQRITKLEEELNSYNDPTRIQELEKLVDKIIRERDIKQLQLNDLTRSLEEMQESIAKASSNEETRLRNLQASLDRALSDKERLKIQFDELSKSKETMESPQLEKTKVLETPSDPRIEKLESSKIVESQLAQSLDIEAPIVRESGWDDEAKLDDEIWSWNPDDAQLAEAHSICASNTVLPNLERRLNARIAELEDTIRDQKIESEKLIEEAKTAQIRSGKLVKKLKEFKIQNESLQQQLNIQKANADFCDLDTAIEEELKSQIDKLEKALNEAKEETRKTNLERDNLAKRIDVLSSANERLVEMKERQDMEVEVLQIRTHELSNKLQSIDRQFRESCDEPVEDNRSSHDLSSHEQAEFNQAESPQSEAVTVPIECLCKKYRADIDELRDEMEALATENEQLQKLLEEQRATRLTTESKLNERLSESLAEIDSLSQRNNEIQIQLTDTLNNYQSLMDQCARENKNSQEKIDAAMTSHDTLKLEFADRAKNFEAEIVRMRDDLNSSNSTINRLQDNLNILKVEKEELLERTKSYEETTERLASLGESMNDLTDLLNSRVQEIAELKREIQRLKADRNEALTTVEDLAQNHTRELSIKNEETQHYIVSCESRLNEQSLEIVDLREKLSNSELEITTCRVNLENMRHEIERLNNSLVESKSHCESLQSELASKEQELFRVDDELRKYVLEVERLNAMVDHVQKSSANMMEEANRRIHENEERETHLKRTISELTTRESDSLLKLYSEVSEKDSQVASLRQTVVNLEEKIHEVVTSCGKEKNAEMKESSRDDSSDIKTSSDEIRELQNIIEDLRNELSQKDEEIQDYRYQLRESTYPAIIQALQDQVNTLYEEKAKIEESLDMALKDLSKEREIRDEFTKNSRYQSRQLKSYIEDDETSSKIREDNEISKIRNAEDEIKSLRIEIDERAVRYRDLEERYESIEIEINELRAQLASKEETIVMLQQRFDSTRQECELLRSALKKNAPKEEIDNTPTSESSLKSQAMSEQSSNELDFALYMLHQRDVRCEELTLELMQLLEERDTLQLRLSNAIRVNEDLRRSLPVESQSTEVHKIDDVEPIVEQPSPSRSVGPVEIAKEAIDTPNEEKIVLAEKLSQLHNMGHRRDIRLMDDRELRHNQQMSLLAHRDVLSTLPPEAAARFVNANYTLSRDVQSQSSILMNWLWGKSTPKVVHM